MLHPLSKPRQTSAFGMRLDPISKTYKQHKGQDTVAANGDWNVREVTLSTVIEVSAAYNYGRGNLVRTKDKRTGDIKTFQHLASMAVKVGQEVKKGDIIGVAGNTGDSTGRHLHFEVTRNSVPIEPLNWLAEQAAAASDEVVGKLRILAKGENDVYFPRMARPFTESNYNEVLKGIQSELQAGEIVAGGYE